MSDTVVGRELRVETVFKDESKLSFDYVPSQLLHREEELKMLSRTFRPIIDSPGQFAPTAIIRGQLGTGKTALSKRFGIDFERYATARKLNFKYIHVNCREEGSFYNALKSIIIRYFEKAFPIRGYSSQELLNIFSEILDRSNVYTIITLDELESMIKKEGSEPLFNLTRLPEKRPLDAPKRFGLICVFREPECDEVLPILDRSTLSTLGFNVVRLEKYSSTQLKDILKSRVEEAFKDDAVLPDAVELISDLSSNYGDARFAIELLWLAGKNADALRLPKVYPDNVRAGQAYAHPSIKIEDLKFASLHEKFLLLSAARLIEREDSAYIPTGELEKEYRAVCEEYGEEPRGHTQVWKYLKALSISGLISTKISGKGQRGKTSFIGLYVPSDRLEKELLKLLGVHGER